MTLEEDQEKVKTGVDEEEQTDGVSEYGVELLQDPDHHGPLI